MNETSTAEEPSGNLWLDHVDRKLINSGGLNTLMNTSGITGASFDISAFSSLIENNTIYDEDIMMYSAMGLGSEGIYKGISIEETKRAADIFKPVYEKFKGNEGFVSLGISPHFAYDSNSTVMQAKELRDALGRKNVMIQIPATKQSLPAIRQCIKEGININITTVFGLTRYREVVEAYISGLQDRISMNYPIDRIFSVISFGADKLDELTDPILERRNLSNLKGKIGAATAEKIFKIFLAIFNSEPFKLLEAKGAKKQLILWGNTETKIADHISAHTITLIDKHSMYVMSEKAYSESRNGKEPHRPPNDPCSATRILSELDDRGIDINIITEKAEELQIKKLISDYKDILDSIQMRDSSIHEDRVNLTPKNNNNELSR